MSITAAAQNPPPSDAATPTVTGVARTAARRCRAHPNVSVCDDALRWNPSDASLLIAMGDALVRVRRPADAVRKYRRAATLAANTPGIQEKIKSAQASIDKPSTRRPARDASSSPLSGKRFSNSDPDTQTH